MIQNDFVRTPKIITEALLQYEKFDGLILEPCCGDGAISKILQSKYPVISTDKFDYGFGAKKDLFDITDCYDNIITNPPFTQQVAVAKHLLTIVKKKMALLWYVKNIGNVLESRNSRNLKIVYIINQRIDWEETKLGWLFAWYVWDKEYNGDILIKRISVSPSKFQNVEETQFDLFKE